MSLMTLQDLSVRRGRRHVLDSISLRIDAGEFVGLIGPNGAGKTTLLRAALGLLPAGGQSSLAGLAPPKRARAVAFLPQGRDIAWPVTVADLVALGRPAADSAAGREAAVSGALALMGLQEFADRPATALSGGEQARVLIARALAQETPLLLADEPVAGLDPEAQIRCMQVFAGLATGGRAVLASIHDLGLAARYCTRILVLDQGRILADGPPETVLDEALMARVFGIRFYRAQTAEGLVVQPMGVVR